MPKPKTVISTEPELSAQKELLKQQRLAEAKENLALLEEINASCDDTPDPKEEKRLKAAQRSFLKMVDGW